MSGLLDPRQWLLIVALCAASGLGVQFWSARLIAQGDTAGYDRARAETVASTLAASEKARERETEMQAAADKTTEEKSHEITVLRRDHAAALERLRNRPQRPARAPDVPPTPSTAAPASGCTGAELYRQDGEFSAGEAARAEQIRIELKACYRRYDQARDLTNIAGG